MVHKSRNVSSKRNPERPQYPHWVVVDSTYQVHGRVQAINRERALQLAQAVYPEITEVSVIRNKDAAPELRRLSKAFPLIDGQQAAKHGLGLSPPVHEWAHELQRKFPRVMTAGGGSNHGD